jgi:hypothetical protein
MTASDAVVLIPRADLFGNPVKTQAQISPNGAYISWLAPLDGVLNVFIVPRSNLSGARALTFENRRPVPGYGWAGAARLQRKL